MPETMDGWDIETKKQDLWVQRAKYVYDFLARCGIDTTRMSYRGFGAHGKIFPHEENSELMMRNRRVEIKILSW
jgi:flagellar motor protein MotB